MDNEKIDQFWHRYLQTLPEPERQRTYYESFKFGEGATADALLRLVLAGVKTATSDLLWSREALGRPLWQVGDLSIALDSRGEPHCVIETTELRVLPFDEVDQSFAYDYGEGERTLAWWQDVMWQEFVEMCAQLDRRPDRQMPLICERFRVVYQA